MKIRKNNTSLIINRVFYGKTNESIGCSEECNPLDFGFNSENRGKIASRFGWLFAEETTRLE